MTLLASRHTSGDTDLVTFRYCYGPVTIEFDEQFGHATQFWHQLGGIVATPDITVRAKAGYERFHAALGDGAPPEFGQLPSAQRMAWVEAFTE